LQAGEQGFQSLLTFSPSNETMSFTLPEGRLLNRFSGSTWTVSGTGVPPVIGITSPGESTPSR
jgi:hypothetical protein